VAAVLDYARQLEEFSPDYLQMLDALVSLLARIALFQAAGRPYDEDDDVAPETLAELAGAIAAEDLQLYWQVGVLGRRDLPLATDQRSAFALTLLRMLAFRPGAAGGTGEGAAGASGPAGAAGVRAALARGAAAPAAVRAGSTVAAATAPATSAVPAAGAAVLPLEPDNWARIIDALGIAGPARQLAANCALGGRQGNRVKLLQDARATRTPGTEAKLAEALSRYLGEKVQLVFETAAPDTPASPARELQRQDGERLAQARAALESDPAIQAMQRQMGATIFPESVRPNFTEEN
jgi:DNA polymerase-3 subunit gamma/tau